MGKIGKVILLNIGILLMYNIVAMLTQQRGASEAQLGAMMMLLVAISFHVLTLLVTSVVSFLRGNKELGNATIISALVVLIIGFPACIASGSVL